MIEESETNIKKSQKKDLSILSIDDLEEYIYDLKEEIKRAEKMIKLKDKARIGAESAFKKY